MTDRYRALRERLERIEAAGLRRHLTPVAMTSPVEGRLPDGRPVVVFSSNDYLGLAQHPEVVAAWRGAGAGSARLIAGDRPLHHALEAALSEWLGRPATLFSSGWHANLAAITTLAGRGDRIASDRLNHASIVDAVRLSRAEKAILPHLSPQIPAGTRLAVVEGLYSMEGDTPELAAYRGEHWLMVDEAHAVGALGPKGRGAAAAQGVEPDVVVGTLGKALGAYGAFVVGPPELRELLLSRGRTFIFTTGLPEPVARAALAALRLADDARRQRLAANVRRLRQGLEQLGLTALGHAHIVPVVLGSSTMAVARALLDAGFHAPGIRPPTVPAGTERIRFTVSAAHTPEQIDRLLDALDAALRRSCHDSG